MAEGGQNARPSAKSILEHVHCDTVGPIIPISKEGYSYMLVIVDKWSRYISIYFLEKKQEIVYQLISHLNSVQSMLEVKVKKLTTGNGTEFNNQTLKNYCQLKGIELEFVAPYTSEQLDMLLDENGTWEFKLRVMMRHSELPLEWWPYAAETVCHVNNHLPNFGLESHPIPYERWHNGKKSNIMEYVRVFGSVARVHTPEVTRGKLGNRSWTGILVGYTPMGCYEVLNLETRSVRTVLSHHVSFNESLFISSIAPELASGDDEWIEVESQGSVDLENNIAYRYLKK